MERMNRERISADGFKHILRTGASPSTGKLYFGLGGSQLVINGVDVTGEVVLDGWDLATNYIKLDGVRFQHVRLEHEQVKNMHFYQCEFRALVIEDAYVPGSIDESQIEILRLENYSGPGSLLLKWPAAQIIVSHTTVSETLAEALRPSSSLHFVEGCSFQKLTLHQPDFDRTMPFTKFVISQCSISQQLQLSNWWIEEVTISELRFESAENSSLSFEFCRFSHLRMDNIEAYQSVVSFRNVSFEKKSTALADANAFINTRMSLLILDSQFEEMRWAFCDWSRVPMVIENISVDKVRLQGSTTPRSILSTSKQWKEVADLYGQFESHARSQGHTADAITNRASALRAYRIYLSKQGRDYLDRITLWLSERISDYGSNWLRALTVLLGSSLILFVLLLLTTDSRIVFGRIDSSTSTLTLKYAGYFLEFLSPFHSSNFLELSFNPLGKIVDLISRIWIGFVIYQLVRSTRKFIS